MFSLPSSLASLASVLTENQQQCFQCLSSRSVKILRHLLLVLQIRKYSNIHFWQIELDVFSPVMGGKKSSRLFFFFLDTTQCGS